MGFSLFFPADCTYEELKKRFLMTGKGRRPDVTTQIPLTNRLLLQLYFLRVEGSETEQKVRIWFL